MSLSIYIPRILGSVTRKTVHEAFSSMKIGTITELDMIYKINENHNAYYFAFIQINPYNTPEYYALQRDLEQNRYVRLTYDEEAGQYWEIKKYIPRNQRGLFEQKHQDITYKHVKYDENIPPKPEYNLWGLPISLWTPIAPVIESITNAFDPPASIFTAQDKLDLVKEYEELEKEIYIHVSCI